MTDTQAAETVRPSDLVRDDLPALDLDDQLSARPTIEDLEEALKDVVDPELGINVVDLGLIYGLHLEEDNSLTIDMTLTSAACPLTDVIEDQTQTALDGLVERFVINWVWMPPWGMEKITDDGRDQLRALGFNISACRRLSSQRAAGPGGVGDHLRRVAAGRERRKSKT